MRLLTAAVFALLTPGAVDSGQEDVRCANARAIRRAAVSYESWLEAEVLQAFELMREAEPGTVGHIQYRSEYGAYDWALRRWRGIASGPGAPFQRRTRRPMVLEVVEAQLYVHGCDDEGDR